MRKYCPFSSKAELCPIWFANLRDGRIVVRMTDATRTGFHGLPAEYRTPEGTKENLEATLGYLEALVKSKRPVVVAGDDVRMETPGFKSHLYQQIGFLRKRPTRTEAPTLHLFDLNWPDPEQGCGLLTLDERLFEGATLGTDDGDDYFSLSLACGPVTIRVMDSNINMDRAATEWRERQHRTYLDLPTPSEIEEKWQLAPNREVVREIKPRLAEIRAALAERGVTAQMSDAELEAASNRVSWTLRTSGRMAKVPNTEWLGLFLDDLAAALREKPAAGEAR